MSLKGRSLFYDLIGSVRYARYASLNINIYTVRVNDFCQFLVKGLIAALALEWFAQRKPCC